MKESAMCASIVEAMLQVVETANCVENYERRDSRNFEIHFYGLILINVMVELVALLFLLECRMWQ